MTRRRPAARTLAALGLGLGLLPAPARAQDAPPDGPRHMRVEMDRGHATIRLLINPVTRAGIEARTLSLPRGMVVTAMRARHGDRWLGATLRPAAEAEEEFLGRAGLTSPAPASWRALLAWDSPEALRLRLATPSGRARGSTLELTALAPTAYEDGRERLDLGPALADGPLTVEVAGGREGDQLLVDGESVGAGGVRAPRQGLVELVASDREPLRGLLEAAVAGRQTLVRARLDTPARLSESPREASVVVVLDTSRSMGPARHRAAASLARAYLERLPDARAAVVAFDRAVRPLQPSLVSAADALASLARPPPPRNGSRLDLALAEAASLLDGRPGPRRVLVLTDGLVRSSLHGAALRELAARTGAVVHLGIVDQPDGVQVTRDDHHPWSEAARATGGLVWSLRAPSGRRLDPGEVEPLVRPVAVERITRRWLGPGMKDDDTWPDRLAEGEGHELAQAVDGPPGVLEVQGELWATPVRCRLAATAAGDAAWTRLAVNAPVSLGLDEPQQRDLARRARVVSPFGSLLAVGPGPHADLREQGALSLPIHGRGEPDHGQLRGVRRASTRVSFGHHIDDAVEVAWHRCTGGRTAAAVTVELTPREVVDVSHVKAASDVERRCLTEAVWGIDVHAPAALLDLHRLERHTVELPRR